MADESKKTLGSKLAAIEQNRRAALKSVQATPPQDSGDMSVSGFGENILDDAGDLLKGLFLHLPVAAYHGVKKTIQDPSVLGDVQGDRVLGAIKDALIEPYQKHGLKVAYYRPLSTTLDALALWGVAAKSAGLASKMSGSARGLQFAREMEALPGKLVSEGVDSVAKKFGLDLKAKRELLNKYKRVEASSEMRDVMLDDVRMNRPLSKFDDAKKSQWDEIRAASHQPGEAPVHPDVLELLEAGRNVVKEWDDYLITHKHLTAEEVHAATIKKLAARRFGDISPESIAKAERLYETADIKPFYGPDIEEINKFGIEAGDFFELPKDRSMGKPGFLQNYTGSIGVVTDPAIYMSQATRAFHAFKRRVTMAERVAQNQEWVRAGKAGEVAKAGETAFHDVVPKAFRNEADLAGGSADAVSRKMLDEAKTLFFKNDTIRRELSWEYMKRPGGMIKVYDAILNAFKSGATRYNPHWYTGNIIGDAIMGVLYGGEWQAAKRMLREKLSPVELSARPSMGVGAGGIGNRVENTLHIHGMLETGGEIVGSADEMYRAGIMMPEIKRGFERVGRAWEPSAASLEPVLSSTEDFSKIQVRLQLMGEEIAARSPQVKRLDTQIERLRKIDKKLDERLVGHEEKRLLKDKTAKNQVDDVYHPIAKQQQKAPANIEYEIDLRQRLVRQRITNLQEARGQVVRDIEERLVKTGELQRQIPGLQEQMNILIPAINRANAFVGEYNGLSGFEQQVMRRVLPFYSWAKAMNMLAFRLPFIAPVKTFMWNRFGNAMMSLVGDKELPPYAKGYLPMFALEDGTMGWMRFESFSPFGSVKPAKVGGIPVPGPLNLAQSNPIIGLGFKAFGGENVFQQTNIPYGAKMVSIYTGDVYEFTQQGTVKKVIPQDPMISSILHTFPLTQFIEQVLTPYRAHTHNALGFPIPQFNPDGSYKYPREWWERLSTLVGLPLVHKDRTHMIQAQKAKIYKVVSAYKNAYNRATPDQQKFIREVLSDYQAGRLREME